VRCSTFANVFDVVIANPPYERRLNLLLYGTFLQVGGDRDFDLLAGF
jgi:23S rRNA G2445 N2-methylase RlmL